MPRHDWIDDPLVGAPEDVPLHVDGLLRVALTDEKVLQGFDRHTSTAYTWPGTEFSSRDTTLMLRTNLGQ